MKKASIVLIVVGIVMAIVGSFIFNNLNYVNAVDAHAWSININGIRSFPWIGFLGGVLLVIGIIFNISAKGNKSH
ncbi:hypothetical protein GM921_12555 [Pedobacter sp. LMG 31464]|uniref:Uncharacterized protein n=1 Tax=Pedobacter planticolens TaxID=2679964 RepID=A0A923IWM3_9SPHI|nr:hypothetical protein [Pedobacter planticolens]MBB2146324.1 hypothetical protein [Pedobacter planticolens]